MAEHGREGAVSEAREAEWRFEMALRLAGAEVERQERIHPQGFEATRDGLRYGLATIEDELDEAKGAWRSERRKDGWDATEEELVQTVAVGLRLLRVLLIARDAGGMVARAGACRCDPYDCGPYGHDDDCPASGLRQWEYNAARRAAREGSRSDA